MTSLLNTDEKRSEKKIKERNYGIDLLRITAMFMVVVLHILGCGGVLSNSKFLSVGYETAWALEILALCAVNCYAVISGYVGYGSKFRLSSILRILVTVVFYAFAVTAVFALAFPKTVTLRDVYDAVSCIWKGNGYWYFTAYFCAFFFFSFLNDAVASLGRERLKMTIVFAVALFCIIPTVTNSDLFITAQGYSPLWLMVLYVIGAYIKKYEIGVRRKPSKMFLAYFACSFLSLLGMTILNLVTSRLFGEPLYTDAFTRYTSPLMLCAAVCLFIAFSNLKVGKIAKKLVAFFAPMAFSVYIIHTHRLVWICLLTNRFSDYSSLNPLYMTVAVLLTAFVIWLACSVVDWFRIKIFELLRINSLCKATENCLKKVWRRYLNKR